MARFYRIAKKLFPSVTSILSVINKPGLYYWYGKMGVDGAKRAVQRSSKLGSEVHRAIHMYFARPGSRPKLSKKARVMFEGWKEWYEGSGLKVKFTERTVHCSECMYAGTLDFYGFDKKKRQWVIIDWKTGKQVYPEHHLQAVAYTHALIGHWHWLGPQKKKTKHPVDAAYIVRIGKDGKIRKTTIDYTNNRFEDFKAVLGVWRWMNRNESTTES